MQLSDFFKACATAIELGNRLPWEKAFAPQEPPPLREMIPPELMDRPMPAQAHAEVGLPPPPPEGPGCAAAEGSLLVHSHLERLANGWPGFGVLAVDRERLERAAAGAEISGDAELADALRREADGLPAVRDEDAAAGAASRLEPLLRRAWDLGRRCGGAHNPAVASRAQELSDLVNAGELTREEAVEMLKGEIYDGQPNQGN